MLHVTDFGSGGASRILGGPLTAERAVDGYLAFGLVEGVDADDFRDARDCGSVHCNVAVGPLRQAITKRAALGEPCMWMLVGGLVFFFSAHLVPTIPALRTRLVGAVGSGPYSGLFALVSLVALVLIVFGYGQMQGLGRGNPQLWAPPSWARHVTMLLMVPAIVLLVAAYVPSRIRTAVRHPMLMGVALWAFSHLLANGDLASVLLFGSFLAYGVYDVVSANQRAAFGPLGSAQGSAAGDFAAIAGGLALYALLLFWGHRWLTGVPLVP